MTRQLTSQDVYSKQFKKVGMRGYNAKEVDAFLDIIMQDYDSFTKEIAQLKQMNTQLLAKYNQAQQHDKETTAESTTVSGTTNYDILKRISNLEKHVFGAKVDI